MSRREEVKFYVENKMRAEQERVGNAWAARLATVLSVLHGKIDAAEHFEGADAAICGGYRAKVKEIMEEARSENVTQEDQVALVEQSIDLICDAEESLGIDIKKL